MDPDRSGLLIKTIVSSKARMHNYRTTFVTGSLQRLTRGFPRSFPSAGVNPPPIGASAGIRRSAHPRRSAKPSDYGREAQPRVSDRRTSKQRRIRRPVGQLQIVKSVSRPRRCNPRSIECRRDASNSTAAFASLAALAWRHRPGADSSAFFRAARLSRHPAF